MNDWNKTQTHTQNKTQTKQKIVSHGMWVSNSKTTLQVHEG